MKLPHERYKNLYNSTLTSSTNSENAMNRIFASLLNKPLQQLPHLTNHFAPFTPLYIQSKNKKSRKSVLDKKGMYTKKEITWRMGSTEFYREKMGSTTKNLGFFRPRFLITHYSNSSKMSTSPFLILQKYTIFEESNTRAASKVKEPAQISHRYTNSFAIYPKI